MVNDFSIVNIHPDLLKYVDYLQNKNAEALSFYPLSCFEREMTKGRILLSLLNNEPCGYLYFGALLGNVKIHQVCIQYDVRRKLYGAMLVGYLEKLCINKPCMSITLRCGFDLDANKFWQDLGYSCVNIVDGGIRRMRRINVWQKPLHPIMDFGTVEPAEGKTDASIWRKNKKVGLISSFDRGKINVER